MKTSWQPMRAIVTALGLCIVAGCADRDQLPSAPDQSEHIVFVGNGLCFRMVYFPSFESSLHRRFSNADIVVRNLCRPGDTAGFRPHPARDSAWAFPGAERFHPRLVHHGKGSYPTPDQWLKTLQADTIVAFFGYNESFEGQAGIENFRDELAAFVKHTRAQSYNGTSPPRLVLVSPIPFEDLSQTRALPDGTAENERIAAYAEAMENVASELDVQFVDAYRPMLTAYKSEEEYLTINGFSLNERGYMRLAEVLLQSIFPGENVEIPAGDDDLLMAVKDKNWYWLNDYWMLNDIHIYGRRVEPFGSQNYPEEIEKIRQMTALRDERIHELARGRHVEEADDATRTLKLRTVETNYEFPIEFLDVEEAVDRFEVADGGSIDLFASESEFPDLRNPVQVSFDNAGRLWVAVAPSYPHYRPGDSKPDDKLLIFEDSDGDGRADKMTTFADRLHLPFGFELAPEGVYVAQMPNLVLLADDNGDDRADRREILLHGFDSHDSHHAISAFAADASGAIYMNEGLFLHSQVETPYGPQRGVGAGVWRFDPRTWRLERFIQARLSNPWAFTFDAFEQPFVSDASPGENWWAEPLSVNTLHGGQTKKGRQFTTHTVRPTAGSEFISSRHFPDEYQGDFLINNTIGFLGIKQHSVSEDGAGYTGELRQDLLISSDPNFRPVALEFAPDGSLFVVDWHNPLIGHMQHSVRDPNRDHDHGRIYRITYPARALVEPAEIDGATIDVLLDNLKLPEYRTRYRTRRELRGRNPDEVLSGLSRWVDTLKPIDQDYERLLLEALWVSWGQNSIDQELLEKCLTAKDHRVRAAAVHVLRYAYRQVPNYAELFVAAGNDEHPRVRLETVVAASWLDDRTGALVALEALRHPITDDMGPAYEAALVVLDDDIRAVAASDPVDESTNPAAAAYLRGTLVLYEEKETRQTDPINLRAEDRGIYLLGEEVYFRDGHCGTCHGEDGRGAVAGAYPPLFVEPPLSNPWIIGSQDRLIRTVLRGLSGTIEIAGETYDASKGVPPMPGFGSLLTDEEVAAVLTYVRMRFGRLGMESQVSADPIVTPEAVAKGRESIADARGAATVDELLAEFPLEEQ